LVAANRPGNGKPSPAAKPSEDLLDPFLKKFCWNCHAGKDPEDGLRLDEVAAPQSANGGEAWDKVVRTLRARQIPPNDATQSSAAQLTSVVAWLERVRKGATCVHPRNPGRVTLRWPNRAEYANTIRDLVGIEYRTAEDCSVGYALAGRLGAALSVLM
jgi:hypothetical protein